MDIKLQEYYESLLDLFSTNGWKHFKEDMAKSMLNLNDLQTVTTAEDFWLRKGQVSILSFIAGYEDAVVAAYEELRNESV